MNDDLEYTVEFDIEAIATKLAAAEALATGADTAILVMYAAQTWIWEHRDGLDNEATRSLQAAIDEMETALRQYREAAR